MKEFEIKFNDFQRMLIGDVPLHFYIEVIFRTALIYLILLVSMRLMGKRMSTQLSRNEMAAVASLAAAVGIPLMNPDKGMLPAVVVAIVIIIYQIVIARKAAVSKKFESLTQDKYNMLVKDGVLNTSAMMLTRISRDRVFSQLRSEGLNNLGTVKRLYFEAAGNFSILMESRPKPGLTVLPEWDEEIAEELQVVVDRQVCQYCGSSEPIERESKMICKNCQHDVWVNAVVNKEGA